MKSLNGCPSFNIYKKGNATNENHFKRFWIYNSGVVYELSNKFEPHSLSNLTNLVEQEESSPGLTAAWHIQIKVVFGIFHENAEFCKKNEKEKLPN